MADEFKKVIGAVVEAVLSFVTYAYILAVFWNGGSYSDIPEVIWGMAVALLGKYGLQKGAEIIKGTIVK